MKLHFSKIDSIDNRSEEECRKIYESLNRLAENNYKNLYERTLNSSATGLTAEQCKGVLSDDFLKYLNEENSGFMTRLINKKNK